MQHVLRWLACVALVVGVATPRAMAGMPTPQKIIAVLDGNQTLGNSTTRRAVSFYDVTDLSGSVFGQMPLFSVWTGYEISSQTNFEDPTAIAFNPFNGTLYLTAFDSGTVGVPDLVGDTQGDYDLYRIDFQAIMDDYVANGRAQGTMYAPATGPDGGLNVSHPDHAGSTIFLNNAVTKIGEVARTQGAPLFDNDLEFINPATLLLLDDEELGDDLVANDHQLRLLNRVSNSTGAATTFGTNEGGFNGGTSQSWESTNAGVLGLDLLDRSEPVDMALVNRDGTLGAWVVDSDGGGDDIGFYEIDLANKTASKKELRVNPSPYFGSFALDEDPTVNANSNDGEADALLIDRLGNLTIIESGFFDATGNPLDGQTGSGGTPGAPEPKVITREILNYDGADTDSNLQNEVAPGAWSVSANLPVPTADDDGAVTNGRFVTIDKGTGQIYFFDIDSGTLPNVVSDVYVFDPNTGTFFYEEQNAVNGFLKEHGIRFLLRGDTNNDGVIDASDIDEYFALMPGASSLTAEQFDLTGDLALTNSVDTLLTGTGEDSDIDELIQNILGTEYGDFNLDGTVSIGDFTALQNSFGNAGGWADGDANGDGVVSIGDFTILQNKFGFNNMSLMAPQSLVTTAGAEFASFELQAEVTAVPEPSSWCLGALGSLLVATYGRRLRSRRR